MAMGTRDPEQPPLWIAASDLPVSPGHPFYTRMNALLDADGFAAVSVAPAGDACGGDGRNSPSDRLPTSMRPAGCDARTCGDTTTS